MSIEGYVKDISIAEVADPKTAAERLVDKVKLSPSALTENFLLLNTRSRDASMFFINSVDEMIEAENVAMQLGLGFKSRPSFIPDPKGGYYIFMKCFTFTNEEKSKEIDRLNPKTPPNSEVEANYRFNPMVHERIGYILDYPFCCIKAYAEDTALIIDPDERLTMQVADYKRKNKAINSDAFYLEEFLPCRPSCENASAKGRAYENDLRKANDTVANLYNQLKQEHLRNVESEKFLRQKESGKRKYFVSTL
jgi:hypothetical protein